jgi:hypothetical protein
MIPHLFYYQLVIWPCTCTLRILTTGLPADLHKSKKA